MISGVQTLASQILEGSTSALARGLTWAEAGGQRAEALSASLYPHTGRAQIVRRHRGARERQELRWSAALALVARARGRTVGSSPWIRPRRSQAARSSATGSA